MTAAALITALGSVAVAETFAVLMLKRGEAGSMVFEPGFLRIAPGDIVKFVASNKGNNAEAIPEMLPEGADGFEGRIHEEIEVILDTEGVYGVRCKPHYAMRMVMVIAVGDATEIPASYLKTRMPKTRKSGSKFSGQDSGSCLAFDCCYFPSQNKGRPYDQVCKSGPYKH